MVLNKSVKRLENSMCELTITVDKESIEKAYSERINKYRKDLQIPGFRKGMAPLSVIERKWGDAIREEATFSTLENAVGEATKDLEMTERPLPYSTPELQDEEKLIPFKKDEDVTFTVKYESYPVFELPQYKGLEIEVDEAEVTDDDVSEEIERLRDQNAIVRKKDGEIAKGDIVTLSYVELDEEGKPVAETERKDFTFTCGTTYNYYRIDDDIVGMKKGEEKVIEKKYEDDDVTFKGKSVKLSVKIDEVKFRDLPEVDDDFAQDVKSEYKTVEDLKKGTREKLEKEAEEKAKNDKMNALVDKLVESVKIDIPSSMLRVELDNSWRNFVKQSGLDDKTLDMFLKMQNNTKEQIMEDWKPSAEKNIKAQLIMEAIQKKEDFKLDEEEYEKKCSEQLKDITDEETKGYYKELIKDEMQYNMVPSFLLENNSFKAGKKVSFKEYMGR